MSARESRDREKSSKTPRPFYELPPNIKPCSKIIQETRLQLKYSAKIGSDFENSITTTPTSSSVGSSGDYEDIPRGAGIGTSGVRAVHTKRPFTPRDSNNLWGVSSRKRPPSAITLSRLSLDEIGETAPLPRTRESSTERLSDSSLNFKILEKNLVPGKSSGNANGTARLLQKTESELEKTRLRFKALSTEHESHDKSNLSKLVEIDKGLLRSNSRGRADSESHNNNNSSETVKVICEEKGDFYMKINNLEVAVEYLTTFLDSIDKVPKEDLIDILRRIKIIISVEPAVEPLKCRLTKLVFKIVERNANDEDILFWASFILLHCQIIGNNLTTVFKMVFKASRSQTYWGIIKESEYLEVFMYSLGQICPLTQTESMIYGYGTLKFICSDESVLRQVIDLNLVSVMVLHLKLLNYEVGDQVGKLKRVPETIQSGVFQLTSILRSMVAIEDTLVSVAESGLLDEICNSLHWTIDDIDVISNIVRVLSVVSGNEVCSEMMGENDSLSSAVVKIFKTWHSNENIVVRTCYFLGNILEKHENFRLRLYYEPIAIEMVIQVIFYYIENLCETSEDIIIKSIRILANWSLNASIGKEICEIQKVTEILNTLLESDDSSDELLLCTISTLNNLSWHKDCARYDENNFKTATCLSSLLDSHNIELRSEVMKVLGNLTRNQTVAKATSKHLGNLLLSLNQTNSELLCATIGVIMNIILQESVREDFLKRDGIEYLLKFMERETDVGLRLMVCQLLWNLLISNSEPGGNLLHRNVLNKAQMDSVVKLIGKSFEEVELKMKNECTLGKGDGESGENKITELLSRDQFAIENSGQNEGNKDKRSYVEIYQEFLSVAGNLHAKLIQALDSN